MNKQANELAHEFHRPVAPLPPNGGQEIAPLSSSAVTLMDVISRAASDPNTDVDKLERLLGMYERIKAQEAKTAYMRALADMQPNLPVISERGEIKIGTGKAQKYALWEDINEAIRPVLHEHGFALSFRTGREGDKIKVTGVLSHRDGHSEETTIELPSDTSGSKNAVQAVGSSTSYGKRYTAIALLNITTSGEDDDGRSGDASAKISEDQLQHIRTLIERVGADIEKLCTYFKVAALPDIKAIDYERVITALNRKEKMTGAKK